MTLDRNSGPSRPHAYPRLSRRAYRLLISLALLSFACWLLNSYAVSRSLDAIEAALGLLLN